MKIKSEKSTIKMNGARWIARIISSVTVLIWGVVFIGTLVSNYVDGEKAFFPSPGAITVFIFYVIMLIGTVIGWWNEKWGAVILIAGFIVSAVGGFITASQHSVSPAGGLIPVMLYLPYLISGVLFYLFWDKNR